MPNTAVVQVRRLVSKNKAVAAGVSALASSLGLAVASWIGSGEFDAAETRLSLGSLAVALIAAGATYLTSAGDAEISTPQFDKDTTNDPIPQEVVVQPV